MHDELTHSRGSFTHRLGLTRPYLIVTAEHNDPKNTARNVKMWCLFHCKPQLHTPPQSPDINIIENLWPTLEITVQKHQIRNKAHLKQVLQEEWDKISPDTTKKLVESVRRRLEDIIKAKGHATKYQHCLSTRGLLATDHVILNHGQVTWTTPELAPPLLTTPPYQREDVSALDRFNVHRCPTRRVFSGTRLELVTRQATARYLYHSATAATHSLGNAALKIIILVDTPLRRMQGIHERIHALAEPISGQTQENSYSKFAFAKPSALSHTPNDVVGFIFRLAAATPFLAVNR
ncbi:transposable element Tcb2 transposase [Trichonephila clavipes]|nr:transposable element Tcb2 transposase [Trichonephila clavipes]